MYVNFVLFVIYKIKNRLFRVFRYKIASHLTEIKSRSQGSKQPNFQISLYHPIPDKTPSFPFPLLYFSSFFSILHPSQPTLRGQMHFKYTLLIYSYTIQQQKTQHLPVNLKR